ncbi:MAG: DUF5818 domain-containing protein [Pseudomonadota bacterium]
MPTIRGTIIRNDLEGGIWELHADDGKHYQLEGGDERLHTEGVRVEIQGSVNRSAFGIGMTGPLLSVKSYRRLDGDRR